MYKKILFPLLALTMLLVACTNTDTNDDTQNSNENSTSQPIHYETEEEQKNRLNTRDQTIGEQGGYPQSDQDGVNSSNYSGGYSDEYTNEETEKLSRQLKDRKDIVQAQVASTDDRVIAAVILKEKYIDHDIKGSIESEVSEAMPDKEVIVYTDEAYFDQMKDMDARRGSDNKNYNIEDYIKDFFERND
ncbi:YhcN/YlaJ family sporulation lipoprotein [Virgibacillus sp. NKC19-16]|uniref:YhcN/YlaJ family sporulation lipoprotein n=1 Tax=Virgibacillus salidurans TaxID=2831673 RepID=UPI001F3D531C|nr:YhcN/YlaJ family sporulation lipoprotein [Virgibacillus sp. NKC19-16]UJL44955.1 YhcN/YlaJ family sporulation lipoprotein [Virgibacillus sp. NKC19-16]